MSNDFQLPQDKLRLCPICRMPISIWAVRCRFCGENVGRPKREIETFTVEDLGGETPVETNIMSEDVMQAIEIFRKELEEEAEEEPQKPFWKFWQKAETTSEEAQSERGERTPKKKTSYYKKSQVVDIREIAFVVGCVLLLAIFIYFFGLTVFSFAKQVILGNSKPKVEYENRAMIMLEAGENLKDVHAEALKAYETISSDDNRYILNQIREKIIEEVNSLINKEPYDPRNLEKASQLISEVMKIDYDSRIQELYQHVIKEVSLYKMMVISIDSKNKKATVSIVLPNQKIEQEVKEGDLIADRFLVTQILSTKVRIEDTKIVNNGTARKLCVPLLDTIRADI